MSQQQFTAGTDHPFFYDKQTDTYYEADWDSGHAFPFGYWNLGDGMKLYVGDACSTHTNPFGKALKDHYESRLYEHLDDDAYTISDKLSDLAKDMQQYGYTYNEDDDEYVSEDQSDFFTVDDKAYEIEQDLYNTDCYDILHNLVQETLQYGTYPEPQEVYTMLENNMTYEYDFQDNRGIAEYLRQNGFSVEGTFMNCGEYMGRIWTENEIISFYTDKQPWPDELPKILQDLSQIPELRITYNDLLNFNIIFEARNQNTGEEYVTACTTSDYISDNYNHNGPDYDDDEEYYDYDDEQETQQQTQQYNQLGMPIHLANQQQKRQFFQNFRNDRDQYINVPKEKAAGTIARYNALRHPYGESKQYSNMIRITEAQLRRIITEAANIILHKREKDPAQRAQELNKEVLTLHDILKSMNEKEFTKLKRDKNGNTVEIMSRYRYPKKDLPTRLKGREGQLTRVIWGDMYNLSPVQEDELGCPAFTLTLTENGLHIFKDNAFDKLKQLVTTITNREELEVTLADNPQNNTITVTSRGRRYAQDPTNAKVWR